MFAVRRVAGAVVRGNAPRQFARTYLPATYKHPDVEDPQLNGYPKLPYVSRQYLPPLGWWDVQMRRNFGDPLHEHEELLSMWGPDIPTVQPNIAARWFSIAALGFFSIAGFAYWATPELKAARRVYPYDGLVKELGGAEANKARVETEDADEE